MPKFDLNKLLHNIANETKSRQNELAVLQAIERDIDIDLANDLGTWLMARGKLKNGTVLATLAFFIADNIGNGEFLPSDGPNALCDLAGAYGDYIHQAAHAVHNNRMTSKN